MGFLDNSGLARFWAGIKSKMFGLGTALSASTNMNDLTTPGVYYYTSSTKPGTNLPSDAPSAARVTVVANAVSSRVTQIIIPSGGVSKYILLRGKDNTTWGKWRTFESTDNYDSTPTTGSLSAVTSDGVFTALDSKANAADLAKIATPATEILEGGNLNNCTEPGNYWCSSANSTSVANIPVTPNTNISFCVTTFLIYGTNRYLQRFTFNIGSTVYAFRIWYRWHTSSGWSAWKEVQFVSAEPDTTNSVNPLEEAV